MLGNDLAYQKLKNKIEIVSHLSTFGVKSKLILEKKKKKIDQKKENWHKKGKSVKMILGPIQ